MKKNLLAIAIAVALGTVLGLYGCTSSSSSSAASASGSASTSFASASAASASASAPSESVSAASASASASSVSASAASESAAEIDGTKYGYAGDDPEEYAIHKYLSEEVGKLYGDGDITVPVVNVFYKDYTNPDEVVEFGDFWLFKYNINGDKLEIASGGNNPGVMHLTKQGDSYVVSAFDGVTDGAGFDPSARELFGGYVDDFFAIHSDDAARAENIKIAVSDYVNLNGLDVTQFSNNGTDMIPLYKG